MSNDIVKHQSKSKAIVKEEPLEQFTITPEEVIKYINPYASTKEVYIFIKQCEMFNLNPFKREIYLIKYSGNAPAAYVMGYEVFLKRAERTKKLDGWEFGTEGSPKKPDEFKAWITIYRKDWTHPFRHEVFYEEYVGKKTDGSVTKFWRDMPRTMLKKVAVSQAFRLAFPDELGGLPYTAEEMSHIDHEKLPLEEIKKEKKLSTINPLNEGEFPDALKTKEELAQPVEVEDDFTDSDPDVPPDDFIDVEDEPEPEPTKTPAELDEPPDDLFNKPVPQSTGTPDGDALKAIGKSIHRDLAVLGLEGKDKPSFMNWLFDYQQKKNKKYCGKDSKGVVHLSLGNLDDLKGLHSQLRQALTAWRKEG